MKSIEEVRNAEMRTIGDYIAIIDGAYHCAKCEQHLGSSSENYKENVALREIQIEDIGPHWIDPKNLIDEDMVFREFFCPECATRLATEVAEKDAPIMFDYKLYE